MAERRVFTIPAGAPFLPTLADALVEGRVVPGLSADGLGWADATIYVPTRRAGQALGRLLGERQGDRARLLPRIVPLAEIDEAGFEVAALFDGPLEPTGELAPAIAPLDRRLTLTALIQRWVKVVGRDRLDLAGEGPLLTPASPADAVALAADLETLMDAFAVEDIAWDGVAEAVESDYSAYFELTLKFLRIAVEAWPDILRKRGLSDAARRRSTLIEMEARRLARDTPEAARIVAGSTGSLPSTAALLGAIAALPNGAVVLPGLDQDLDDAGWTAVSAVTGGDLVHGHPQAILRRLVEGHLRLDRRAVQVLGDSSGAAAARSRMWSEALRPAETTDAWSRMAPAERTAIADAGSEGLALIEASDERDEALCAAIALRETLATPGRTAALITPDRALARRVAAELTRWGITADDSAGVPLIDTPAGRLSQLAADAAAHDFHPIRVLALLANPETRLGLPRAAVERAASVLEIGVLRGPAPARGLDGLRLALEAGRGAPARHAPRPRGRLTPTDFDAVADLVARLAHAFESFGEAAAADAEIDLVALGRAHRAALERLAEPSPNERGREPDESHELLAAFFDELTAGEEGPVAGRFTDYPAFFAALAGERVMRPRPGPGGRRVAILGLLEARLLHFDRVVVGGLDEALWPPRARTDCFLNRPMRVRMGLSAPERRIGQTAHDFVQALGHHDAVVTRALKRGSSPTVPSRFLQRLKAFIGEAPWSRMLVRGERYRRLARLLDTPPPAPLLPRPAPAVDPARFPRALSVTEVETLVRDPYAIFARHVLKLDPLDPLAAAPSAASRGTIIHEVLAKFVQAHPDALPVDAYAELIRAGRAAFADLARTDPALHAQWWLRFERLALAFVDWEAERRPQLQAILVERPGKLAFGLPDGTTFTLRARADRIEARRDGGISIIDFKTGTPPSAREVFAGFSPQLTLEAWMLMRGAFPDLPPVTVSPDLLYVHGSGGRTPLTPRPIEPPNGATRTLAEVIAAHARAFEDLLGRYVRGEAAYVSRPFPKFARRFAPYDHLARVKEWSLVDEETAEEGA